MCRKYTKKKRPAVSRLLLRIESSCLAASPAERLPTPPPHDGLGKPPDYNVTFRAPRSLLAAAEPALCLGSTLLNLVVELVDGLESFGLGVLCVSLGVGLDATGLSVGL